MYYTNTQFTVQYMQEVCLLWFIMYLQVVKKVNKSHYRPEVPREFQEVKIPSLRDNGPEWW